MRNFDGERSWEQLRQPPREQRDERAWEQLRQPPQEQRARGGSRLSGSGRGVERVSLYHTIKQLATLEATLNFILEGIKSKSTHVAFFCREYWGTSASLAQLSLDDLEWNDRLRPHVRQACVLECLSLAVTAQLSSGTMQDIPAPMRLKLKNLLYQVRENCVVFLDLVQRRWQEAGGSRAEDTKGSSPENLDFTVFNADCLSQLREGGHDRALRQHNEKIVSLLRPLCASTKSSSDILGSVTSLLHGDAALERLRVKAVRSSMLQKFCFRPLLSTGRGDANQDPYERFGKQRFASDGTIVLFEPLPPEIADLEATFERMSQQTTNSLMETYALILDLDETLVHSPGVEIKGSFSVRPGVTDFLQRAFGLGYVLAIFTTATQDYADYVLDQIDPNRLIRHRFYRQHTLPWGPDLFVKDLTYIGCDLDRSIIIDNLSENFLLQPNNGITIQAWYDDPQDQALYRLMPLLEELITTRARAPDILQKYKDEIPTWAGFGEAQRSVSMDQASVQPCVQASSSTLVPMQMQQGQQAMGAQLVSVQMPQMQQCAAFYPMPIQMMQMQPWTSATGPAMVTGQAMQMAVVVPATGQEMQMQPQMWFSAPAFAAPTTTQGASP